MEGAVSRQNVKFVIKGGFAELSGKSREAGTLGKEREHLLVKFFDFTGLNLQALP